MHSEIVRKSRPDPDWSYHLLNPRACARPQRERLVSAYRCWFEVWGRMLLQLEGKELAFADDFSRQDEIGALFDGDECVGLSAYRWVDLSLPFCQADSYFAAWTPAVVRQIAERSPRVCIGSNLVVSPGARDRMAPLKLSEVLLALAVRRFKASDAELMVGTMRNDRAMNSYAYRFGAKPICSNVPFHNVPVDLVVFERDAACDIELPQVRWASAPTSSEEKSDDESIGRLRRAAG